MNEGANFGSIHLNFSLGKIKVRVIWKFLLGLCTDPKKIIPPQELAEVFPFLFKGGGGTKKTRSPWILKLLLVSLLEKVAPV